MAKRKTTKRTEFGDWQSPAPLTDQICALISKKYQPQSIFEPNCGQGTFLRSSINAFPNASEYLGLEINAEYVKESRKIKDSRLRIIHDDFMLPIRILRHYRKTDNLNYKVDKALQNNNFRLRTRKNINKEE